MIDQNQHTLSALAIFTLAAVKVATDAFDSGDMNVFSTVDAIIQAIDDFRAAAVDRSRHNAA